MGSIVVRRRKDGSPSYTAQVRIRRGGIIVYSETETFNRLRDAKDWQSAKEVALRQPGALIRSTAAKISIGDLIDKYIEELTSLRPFGRSKLSALRMLQQTSIATLDAVRVTTEDMVAHVRKRRAGGAGPATAGNDLLWLRVVFKYANLVWGVSANRVAVDSAREIARASRLIDRAEKRKRRVSDKEIALILSKAPYSTLPFDDIVHFALNSARRLSEITRIQWDDLDFETHTGVIRDVKHPTKKKGNHKTCKFPPKAWEIIIRQPRSVVAEGEAPGKAALVFPYNAKTISTYFTRAVHLSGVKDLHFHDLRHECVSRLFERGFPIPQVQLISLHDSWEELKRYTNLRAEDVPDR